jgi:L-ascorbate metabolism protein UlaG (beta-lactamase superfamily)
MERDEEKMQLTWYGHAAFLLEGDGKRIGLDPYRAPDVGTYAAIDDTADIVAISHINEKYHSFTQTFRTPNGERPLLVDGLELLDKSQPETVDGIAFTAVRVWENDERQEPIAMVGVTVEGIRFLHMGDCGHALSPEEVAMCGPVDVLLALAGGAPTLTLPDLADFVRALAPRVVIPMHFKNEKINLNIRPVAEFLELMPDVPIKQCDSPTITLTQNGLPTSTEIWVLPPAR